jgi:hypothetical protein
MVLASAGLLVLIATDIDEVKRVIESRNPHVVNFAQRSRPHAGVVKAMSGSSLAFDFNRNSRRPAGYNWAIEATQAKKEVISIGQR